MEPTLRQLRHDLRGRANTLMLCTSVLSMVGTDKERLEFLGEIILAADKLVTTLDMLEALPDYGADDETTAS